MHGAGGAVGQALLSLAKLARVDAWGAADGKHAASIRDLGATPVDYVSEDFTRVVPGGFDMLRFMTGHRMQPLIGASHP